MIYDGAFVGSLSKAELEEFDQKCAEGKAYRSYEGAAGLLGLAKVRLVLESPEEKA